MASGRRVSAEPIGENGNPSRRNSIGEELISTKPVDPKRS
jgi:hypothetical protein